MGAVDEGARARLDAIEEMLGMRMTKTKAAELVNEALDRDALEIGVDDVDFEVDFEVGRTEVRFEIGHVTLRELGRLRDAFSAKAVEVDASTQWGEASIQVSVVLRRAET